MHSEVTRAASTIDCEVPTPADVRAARQLLDVRPPSPFIVRRYETPVHRFERRPASWRQFIGPQPLDSARVAAAIRTVEKYCIARASGRFGGVGVFLLIACPVAPRLVLSYVL